MRMPTGRGLAATLLLFTAAPAIAENGMREIGFGPVQRSMGGAAVGVALDSATLVSNPAGLAVLGRRADAAAGYAASTPDYTASGGVQQGERRSALLPSVGVVLPVGERLTVGLGAFRVSHVASEYRPGFFFGRDAKTSYDDLRVTPAAAWRVDERLAVGLSLNLVRATFGYTASALAASSQFPRDPAVAYGAGATLGLYWRPLGQLSVGLACESPTRFSSFEWDLPGHLIDPFGPLVGGTERLSFDPPALVALGASWQRPGLLVAADVEWIDWSSSRPRYSTAPADTGALAWDLGWSDQVVLKAGAQWEATRALRVRAGYAWGRSPSRASRAVENVALPVLAEHHVTLGVGYAFGPMTVNLSGLWSPEASVGDATYEVRSSQLAVDLGVSYEL